MQHVTARLTPGALFPTPPLRSLNEQANKKLLSFKTIAQLSFLRVVVPEPPVYVWPPQDFIEWNAYRASLVSGFTSFSVKRTLNMRSTLLANVYENVIVHYCAGTMLLGRSPEHIHFAWRKHLPTDCNCSFACVSVSPLGHAFRRSTSTDRCFSPLSSQCWTQILAHYTCWIFPELIISNKQSSINAIY